MVYSNACVFLPSFPGLLVAVAGVSVGMMMLINTISPQILLLIKIIRKSCCKGPKTTGRLTQYQADQVCGMLLLLT